MAPVYFIYGMNLFYFSNKSYLYSVVLGFHMHELCMCSSYMFVCLAYTLICYSYTPTPVVKDPMPSCVLIDHALVVSYVFTYHA